VKGNFPDNCVLAGIPAEIIKEYNCNNNQWE
jgi:acetyltransferase-like isoleucine patch superfamily enzyme